jgi:hypothetical protein
MNDDRAGIEAEIERQQSLIREDTGVIRIYEDRIKARKGQIQARANRIIRLKEKLKNILDKETVIR